MGKNPTVFNYRDYELAQDEIHRLRGQLANMEIKNRIVVTDILEQVKADMCDDYCKVPGICQKAGIDEDLMLKDFCKHCPLERL